MSPPTTPQSLLDEWWYYTVELAPGAVARGHIPLTVPMLPRLLMRSCSLRGMSCLDIGTMEGLTPVLMSRAGGSRVKAIDGSDHCLEKLREVRRIYDAPFDYETVGEMYSLTEKLGGEGFDFIVCSGLLYHVFSPLMVLAGLRASLKRGGLMIVATAAIPDPGYKAEFNAAGRFQEEPNTFWYLSTGLLDYMLRYLRLEPIGLIHQPHAEMGVNWHLESGTPSAHLAVLCRAVDQVLPHPDDEWMAASAAGSWEYEWFVDWERAAAQPASKIKHGGAARRVRDALRGGGPRPTDLTAALAAAAPVAAAASPSDSYRLALADHE